MHQQLFGDYSGLAINDIINAKYVVHIVICIHPIYSFLTQHVKVVYV